MHGGGIPTTSSTTDKLPPGVSATLPEDVKQAILQPTLTMFGDMKLVNVVPLPIEWVDRMPLWCRLRFKKVRRDAGLHWDAAKSIKCLSCACLYVCS